MRQKFEISRFPWGGLPTDPFSTAELEFCADALCVTMVSFEREPRATVTRRDGPVYQDSCLEFFFCPCPERSREYYNFEINPLGTLYIAHSPSGLKKDSAPVDADRFWPQIAPRASIQTESGCWSAQFAVPYAFIRDLTPDFEIERQDHITANFYKCGDFTVHPHYAVWQWIDSKLVKQPDFHRPEYFGKVKILQR